MSDLLKSDVLNVMAGHQRPSQPHYISLSSLTLRSRPSQHLHHQRPSASSSQSRVSPDCPEVRVVLEAWIRAGRATLQNIRALAAFVRYYYNQFLVVIYLPVGNTLESVLHEFSNYTWFTIEQNPMSSMLCLNDSTQSFPRQRGFEKLMFKESRIRIMRDRKYTIQASKAFATGVHMSKNVVGKTLHKTETKIRVTVWYWPCWAFCINFLYII
ncbi:hypothetical protein Ddye_014241 [Dipteronia dyeriana]|uniref:Uncharacterized protein n=1 Tax=Dipteronia dyeriana TaxID=168575 RepID=A0AAE0CKB8_9ROSI|nr:hypothetical protein Ddye_014241 [Dipteronia dyeriana]